MKKLATGVFVSKACKNLRASTAFARDMRPAASALFVAQRSKVILALLLIVGVIPAWAQNGTGGPQPPSCTPTAPAGKPADGGPARFVETGCTEYSPRSETHLDLSGKGS